MVAPGAGGSPEIISRRSFWRRGHAGLLQARAGGRDPLHSRARGREGASRRREGENSPPALIPGKGRLVRGAHTTGPVPRSRNGT